MEVSQAETIIIKTLDIIEGLFPAFSSMIALNKFKEHNGVQLSWANTWQ